MVSWSRRRKRADGGTASDINNENGSGGGSGYEEFRERRIKENKERMQKLGIFDLSLKLKSKPTPNTKASRNVSTDKKPPKSIPLFTSTRRSSRLKSMAPVSYSNFFIKAKEKSSKVSEIRIKEGSKPEIYEEEHKQLLGDCKTTWTLFVDGYDEDGKRIYDSEKGETCHQCRQKTLGRHTHCSRCKIVQGQFCGDCLYMRYGENVIEVDEKPDWICPVCRGICNCSLCRKAKGWAPTGAIYRKVVALGFKSVAHYLIETRQIQTQSEDTDVEILEETPQQERQDWLPDLEADNNEAEMEGEEKQLYCSGATGHDVKD